MEPSFVLWTLAAGGAGAVVVAIVTALANRRKLGADAAEIITKAAAGVVKNLTDDNAELRLRQDKSDARWQKLDNALRVHAAWDAIVYKAATDAGIDIPPPPPLRTSSPN